MKTVCSVEFKPGTKEELLPDFDTAFPYIATCSEKNGGDVSPWHWHQAVELFYMDSGSLEYTTPSGHHVFPAGSAGFINTNIPHTARNSAGQEHSRQLLHLFDPLLIAGQQGSRIEEKYVLPLTTASQIELLPLDPGDPIQAEIIGLIRRSFRLSPVEPGYELSIRSALSEIWLRLLDTAAPLLRQKHRSSHNSEQIKLMMIYVHEHYGDRISVSDLADAAHLSKRACFRVFQEYLHMTPVEYITSYRLQIACRMLAEEKYTVTEIAYRCGLGSSSYFGRVFREAKGCTPVEYRKYWHDRDT